MGTNNPRVNSKGVAAGRGVGHTSQGNMSGKLAPSPASTVVPIKHTKTPLQTAPKVTRVYPQADGTGHNRGSKAR